MLNDAERQKSIKAKSAGSAHAATACSGLNSIESLYNVHIWKNWFVFVSAIDIYLSSFSSFVQHLWDLIFYHLVVVLYLLNVFLAL